MNRKSKTFICPHAKEKVFGDDIIVYCRKCKSELRSQEDTEYQEEMAIELINNRKGVTSESIQRLLDNNQ